MYIEEAFLTANSKCHPCSPTIDVSRVFSCLIFIADPCAANIKGWLKFTRKRGSDDTVNFNPRGHRGLMHPLRFFWNIFFCLLVECHNFFYSSPPIFFTSPLEFSSP